MKGTLSVNVENNYKVQHMNKEKFRSESRLTAPIKYDQDANT